MPNLDPWINQNSNDKDTQMTKTISKFENCLPSIREQYQKMIMPNSLHPISNEGHKKIIEMIDWTLERYNMIIRRNKIQQ